MESKRVKEMIEVMQEDYPNIFDEDVANELIAQYLRIVHIAEQDAEERAVKAVNLLYEELEPMFLHPMAREWVIDKFKAFYNNGGQSDE